MDGKVVSRWPLVGRDRELEAFVQAWGDRRCRGVVVYGSAGVGKSRLAAECMARVVREGFKGARATATAAAARVPLGAIAHLIPSGVDLTDPVRGFRDIAAALTGPQRRRWALLIDDLHLLDGTSARLLQQLTDAGVIRLIGTVRSGESMNEAVGALTESKGIYRIELTAFEQDQAEVALQTALGGSIGRRTLHEFYAASKGNVLYLRELVAGAVEAGNLISDGEIWELTGDRPLSTLRLSDLIETRLAAADEAAWPVLELLALCEPAALADAQAVASLDSLAGLKELGLIHATTDRRRTTLTLAHPLYGEVLQAGISVLRRRVLLLQQAERVEAYGARRRDDALHIATWRLAATGTADRGLLVQAAVLARHAHDYEQVITLIDALPEQDRTTELRMLYGEAHYELGRPEAAEGFLAAADRQAQSDAERLALTMERTQNLFWGAARIKDALAVNEAVRAELADEGMRSALTINEAAMRVFAGQPGEALPLLEGVEGFPDERVRLYGMAMKVVALAAVGRSGEAIQLGERAYAEHVEADDRIVIQHSASQLYPLCQAYQAAGNLHRALEVAELYAAKVTKLDARLLQIGPPITAGRCLWLMGRVADARRSYAEALALSRAHNPFFARLAASGLAAACAVLGDLEAAETALHDAATYPEIPHLAGEERLGEAWLLAAGGRLGEARGVLMEATKAARQTNQVATEALLLTDIARLGGAQEVTARLIELTDVCDGMFPSARTHLALALTDNIPDALLAASNELKAIGANLLAAEAATAAATAWRRVGQPRRASAATQQAQACAAHCQGAHTPLLATSDTAAPLTQREREVALLAATGTPSKDIAATLHLSVRTVDNHLQRVYAKLGITTRRELAEVLGHRSRATTAAKR
ncbi:LuxR C-terminal-related transcriptional regulator [Streptomyces sp. NPDC052013]|uniref:LuxR C-terminal-related transcriptional regulator n=1 Tax=Streptomyces sp. NPDC052013 TaxID=3365679 RepID=UPI0037D56AEA